MQSKTLKNVTPMKCFFSTHQNDNGQHGLLPISELKCAFCGFSCHDLDRKWTGLTAGSVEIDCVS